MKLKGRLPAEEYGILQQIEDNLNEQLFYLQWDDTDVFEMITPDIIDREFTEEAFPHKL